MATEKALQEAKRDLLEWSRRNSPIEPTNVEAIVDQFLEMARARSVRKPRSEEQVQPR